MVRRLSVMFGVVVFSSIVWASSAGDPQLKTEHPWYPGELSCSTFARLWATQAALYNRETGRSTTSDQDKIIASWYWRNLNYFHSTAANEDFFDNGFSNNDTTHEYWTGLFAYGYGLCGTTHKQYVAEMDALFGPGHGRVCGVSGHNSFEAYVDSMGDWALVDHDISTIIFDASDTNLLSLSEVEADLSVIDNSGAPSHNQGWFISGLYYNSPTDNDAYGVYQSFSYVGSYMGYAGAPPMVHLKRGEKFRRYVQPGLGGSTWAFWGINYTGDGIWGPDRNRTWVNQPHLMYEATADTPAITGMGEYANGVFTYAPNFSDGSYQDGVISESGSQVTFEHYSPYIIAATPPGSANWDIYNSGCTNGLVITASSAGVGVQVSTDNGASWSTQQTLNNSLDLTDLVKGHYNYQLRFNAGAASLAGKNISIQTVVQVNSCTIPHLKDGSNTITYQSSGKAVFAAGPNRDQAAAYLISGSFGSSSATMEVPTPRGEKILEVHAAGWASSGSPPSESINYNIRCSTDGGGSWSYIVQNRNLTQLGYQVSDWWSQAFIWGSLDVSADNVSSVQVEFTNDGGKSWRKCEVYLVYETANDCDVRVTFDHSNGSNSHDYSAGQVAPDSSWTFDAGSGVTTNWVEMEALSGPVDPGQPVAGFTASPNPALTGEVINFTDTSTDPDGTIVSWSWDFGDGSGTSTAQNPTYSYAASGTYLVTLTVTDNDSKTDDYTLQVTVNDPVSDVTLQEGVDGYTGCEDTYVVGDSGNSAAWDEWYGNNAYLRCWNYNTDQENQWTFIYFDLSSVSSGTLTGATLRLWIRRENMAPDDIQIHLPQGAWDEQTTWNTKPATSDTGLTFNFPDTAGGTTIADPPTEYVDIDLSGILSTVQGWLDNPSSNLGLAFIAVTNVNADFWSSEYTNSQYRPQLTLQFQGGGPGPDTTVPTVDCTAFSLTGTATDDSGSDPTLTLNGTIDVTVTGGAWSTSDISVSGGSGSAVLVAEDFSGNSTQVSVSVSVP